GLARGQHVLDPIRLPMTQRDGQRVAFAVRGHDGLVRLAGLAAAVLDGRRSGQEARDRLERRVEVFDLDVLEPGRIHHRDAWGVIRVVLCGHGELPARTGVWAAYRHCTGRIST